MHLLVERQTAPAHRQRGAQQVQRLIRLEIGPVDQDQGLGDARQQHPAQGRVERAPLPLQLAVAEQAVGALDAMAQTRLRLEPSPDIGQRQARTADARGDRREQGLAAATVHAGEQRVEASV